MWLGWGGWGRRREREGGRFDGGESATRFACRCFVRLLSYSPEHSSVSVLRSQSCPGKSEQASRSAHGEGKQETARPQKRRREKNVRAAEKRIPRYQRYKTAYKLPRPACLDQCSAEDVWASLLQTKLEQVFHVQAHHNRNNTDEANTDSCSTAKGRGVPP